MKSSFIYSLLMALFSFAGANLLAQTARIQVIHNAADAAAASVDVWINDSKEIENFAFRTATPFIDVDAGTPLTVAIQPPGSISPANPLWSNTYTLANGGTYVLVANGLVDANNYNPFKPFDVYVYDMARESSVSSGNTDLLVFHGSTDAPTVDVVETGAGAGTVIDNFEYTEFAGYLSLPTSDYVLEVRDETGAVTVASYSAPLAALNLQGQALTVLASGFLNPTANNNGPAFGLYVALSTGGDLVQLPAYSPKARIQVIHNAADAAAASVDVWINDSKEIENFAFRTATPFIDVDAGTPLTVAIQPPGSISPANPLWSNTYTLANGGTYVLVANGLVDANNYNPFKPFDVYVYDMARESSVSSGNTDLLVFHGSTDAPTVDVVETGVGAGTVIDNFEYTEFAGYLSLPTSDYVLEVRDETGAVTVAAFAAPLAALNLEDQALTVLASGFLDPMVNNNGPEFGLYVALASGGELVQLPVVTSVEENSFELTTSVYPNPARETMNLNFELKQQSDVRVEMYNLVGSMVNSQVYGSLQSGNYQREIDLRALTNGVYFISIVTPEKRITQKVVVNQ